MINIENKNSEKDKKNEKNLKIIMDILCETCGDRGINYSANCSISDLMRDEALKTEEVQKKIKETGIVELMELVRDKKIVTFCNGSPADIILGKQRPWAILKFNEDYPRGNILWNAVEAELNLDGDFVIRGAKSVVVDDKSNLGKIFGEALKDPMRISM